MFQKSTWSYWYKFRSSNCIGSVEFNWHQLTKRVKSNSDVKRDVDSFGKLEQIHVIGILYDSIRKSVQLANTSHFWKLEIFKDHKVWYFHNIIKRCNILQQTRPQCWVLPSVPEMTSDILPNSSLISNISWLKHVDPSSLHLQNVWFTSLQTTSFC